MRKVSFLFILIILGLAACEKYEQIKSEQDNITAELKTTSVDVSISDTISVDPDLCTELDVDDFDILPGSYYLTIDSTNPYGIVSFNIAPPGLTDEPNQGAGIQIKIAKRYAKKCPTDYCACGIGFRCGFVTWDGPSSRTTEEAERYLDCTVSFDNNQVTVRMDEEIPFGDTGWEIE